MHRMSDRAAFGSVLAADWQQLPVGTLSSLSEAIQSPGWAGLLESHMPPVTSKLRKGCCRSDAHTYEAEAGPMNDGLAGQGCSHGQGIHRSDASAMALLAGLHSCGAAHPAAHAASR